MRYRRALDAMITTTSGIDGALRNVLAKSEYVAVDTEFLREQTFWPLLCLIQLAGPKPKAVIDPLAPGLDLAPFYRLMADSIDGESLPRGAPRHRDHLSEIGDRADARRSTHRSRQWSAASATASATSTS